ncbi:MAG: hypothetical protein M0R06_18990 [Sphaerochaeta sp.]|jgi:hypothetical protein|nr:hypothetical protein [Sphaerochaeta sp.]
MRLYAIRLAPKGEDTRWPYYVASPVSQKESTVPTLFTETGLRAFQSMFGEYAWLGGSVVEVWEASSEMPYTMPVDPVEKPEETPKTPVNIDPLTIPKKPDIVTA